MKTSDHNVHHDTSDGRLPEARIKVKAAANLPPQLKGSNTVKLLVLVLFIIFAVAAVGSRGGSAQNTNAKSDDPANQGTRAPRQDGNAKSGQSVFRSETFGNEGFWTDAARVPQGVVAARVTPLMALQLGLSVNVDALDAATKKAVAAELKKDPTGRTSALFNDPATTVKLVNANAVIGLVVKDSNGDGRLDVGAGDKLGISCALCHAITDGSVLNLPTGGSIGREVDGPTNHNLNVGSILATAANSRAFYPVLQLSLKANGGKTLGRAPQGLTENSTEAEVDAYLSNPNYYPVGMFDDSPDGNGDPMHITPFFRQDLAAPFGSEGSIARLDNFNNLVYTALFDPTDLTTPGGRAFLHKLGGAAGDEIADDYVKVLRDTGVTGYPFVKASTHPQPGSEDAPLGVRVDNGKLLDLNAYLVSLPAPKGERGDGKMVSRGRDLFRASGCVTCHNVDQSKPVPAGIVPMKSIFPGDNPVVLAQRMPPLNPVMDTPGVLFDDKMAVVNASIRGEVRGIALPLLLDLARKPVFLHDNSVPSLDRLFDPTRGTTAPHPFFISDTHARADLIAFLHSLDTR
jgi:cytochrome c2